MASPQAQVEVKASHRRAQLEVRAVLGEVAASVGASKELYPKMSRIRCFSMASPALSSGI